MSDISPEPERVESGGRSPAGPVDRLDPRVARLKHRMLTSPYEICLARALCFTRSYRETEGRDPHLRNALALQRTLSEQKVIIYADEFIAGNKTEKYLAGPLSVERGDFLRALQMEMDIMERKHRPFRVSEEERRLFWEEIFPYWNGRTVRDLKARKWEEWGLVNTGSGLISQVRGISSGVRFAREVGRESLKKMLGANLGAAPSRRRMRNLSELRFEYARNNPTPAIFCFDVQGHLSLGVDKVVTEGMEAIIARARERREKLEAEEPGNQAGRDFLEAVVISLEAAILFAERLARRAGEMAAEAAGADEQERLRMIAGHLARVPRQKPRTFPEAVQAAWIAQMVGEIQYGTHEVFAPGRADQYLYPYYRADLEAGRITPAEAVAWLQELFLKLSANVEPIPEVGMETNGILGNSQHVITIGGLTPEGGDATNELSYLILDAFEQMNGAVSQLSVRFHPDTPEDFIFRTAEVFRQTSGISIHNDPVNIAALEADGMAAPDARDYDIVGCIETSGQSDTHGCPGGHELVLPAVLWLTLSRGKTPPPLPGQQRGFDAGDPQSFKTFEQLTAAFRRQLAHQVSQLVQAVAGKDEAYMEIHPAPYVSALMDDCIEKARDITRGGARYDFTSLDVRGLATTVDSLLALRTVVYEKGELGLPEFIGILKKNFSGREALRQMIIQTAPKYGTDNAPADALALEILDFLFRESQKYRNRRGGRFRMCYYSYGNHVIDGFFLRATPDGRHRGEPISNGVSPSNLVAQPGGPLGPMRTVARFPAEQISSGIALNLRFHPNLLKTEEGVKTFARMIQTYFKLGGMHIQPNVVSSETLRAAQKSPEKYRDLVVKVSGYSAYFCDLGKSIQEDIIARTEFGRSGAC